MYLAKEIRQRSRYSPRAAADFQNPQVLWRFPLTNIYKVSQDLIGHRSSPRMRRSPRPSTPQLPC